MTESTVSALAHRARIGQFVSVGIVGATIETIIVALLTTTIGLGSLIAKSIGAEISITAMFVINDRWTFAENGNEGIIAFLGRWLKSHLVRIVGLSVGFLVLFLLTGFTTVELPIAGIDFWPTVANGIGICLGMVFNYIAESVLTWRVIES